jgi:hypothetical protein
MTGGGGSLAISAIMRLHGAAVPLHRWRASGADVFAENRRQLRARATNWRRFRNGKCRPSRSIAWLQNYKIHLVRNSNLFGFRSS